MLFSNAIYKLFEGNCPGQKFVVTCSRRNFMGGSCPELVDQGGLFWEKHPRGKSPEGNCSGGNFMGGDCPGLIVLWEIS